MRYKQPYVPGLRRKKDTSTVNESFADYLKEFRLKDKYEATQVTAAWGEMMGQAIASRTTKIYLNEAVLYVQLNSSAMRQELTMAKARVLEIIWERFPKEIVFDVRFL
ncbi:DUF721 domain-containing protein [Persicobacter psychrovividus]|uniref:DUF721 domain-containing protein n=1 Tax=Persicobacter psychrovividus TaxID=387638 RepID=A0ABM7VGT8_9BACT|nr:hypothetical protein PEPS_24600 [Persicobacter psychrovividus]